MKDFISYFLLFIVLNCVNGRRVVNPCGEGKIPCDDGECVRKVRWCDEEVDCTDRSDEKYCKKRVFNVIEHTCTDKHFQCDDGVCFPAAIKCDDDFDCWDFSDERNCDAIDEPLPTTERVTTTSVSTREIRREIRTTPLPTTTGHYDRRWAEDSINNNRRTGYDPAPPASNIPHSTDDRRPHDSTNYHGSSDSSPDRSYPSYQQPSPPSHTIDTIAQRRPDRTRTRQPPSRTSYPHIERDTPLIFPPRSVLYPPKATYSSTRRNVKSPSYSPFHFYKNYTRDSSYNYGSVIRNAKAWLLNQRDESYTWGRDTHRALIALSLITNSFKSDVEENELMKKSLQTYLGMQLLRNQTGLEIISPTRLAVYINALLATCQDPRDFMGINLVEVLYYRQYELRKYQRFVNPIIYLTLCLTDMTIHVPYLEAFLVNFFPTEISKDLHILATTAMACAAQRYPNDYSIRDKLDDAARSLLTQMNLDDGSFGSKYSTALAAQALMSVNTSLRWDHEKTLNYLSRQQEEDGSFGDMQSTYYTLIALSGRSLVHLRNTMCDPIDTKRELTPEDIMNKEGPRKSVIYTLRVGYPEIFSVGMQLSIHQDTNFFDIMRVAAHQDPRFKFQYEVSKGNLYSVHTIANIPNDPERGMFWTLYRMGPSERSADFRYRVLDNVIDLVPAHGEELVFWYLSEI